MNLFLNGQPMNDEHMLSNYNVANQSTIDMDIGLVGGKVHGSLARAGKVKGQTPKVSLKNFLIFWFRKKTKKCLTCQIKKILKVAKQEGKKKPKTGRAKRRLQYNRRFVNVVMGPGGRRKGPNAGAGVTATPAP